MAGKILVDIDREGNMTVHAMGFPGKNGKEKSWAGIDVMEHVVSKGLIIPIGIYSNRLRRLETLLNEINNASHPHLFRMKGDISKFTFVFRTGEDTATFSEDVQLLLQRYEEGVSAGVMLLYGSQDVLRREL